MTDINYLFQCENLYSCPIEVWIGENFAMGSLFAYIGGTHIEGDWY